MESLKRSTKTITVVVTCLLFLVLGTTNLTADSLVPGKPTANGFDTVDLLDQNNHVLAHIPVMITASMTPQDKGIAIEAAIEAAGYSASLTSTAGVVTISATGGVAKWKFGSATGEMNSAILPAAVLTSGQASLSLGFGGSLSGIGFPGHQALYTGGVGFDLGRSAILAQSSITYASLTNKTLSGLLTLTFNNLDAALPPADRALLSLNLATDSINFTPPLGATNVFVESLSLDRATSSSVGGAAVTPEPSTIWLAVTGAGFIFGATKFQHRRSKQKGVLLEG